MDWRLRCIKDLDSLAFDDPNQFILSNPEEGMDAGKIESFCSGFPRRPIYTGWLFYESHLAFLIKEAYK